jgi:hypothetical protein
MLARRAAPPEREFALHQPSEPAASHDGALSAPAKRSTTMERELTDLFVWRQSLAILRSRQTADGSIVPTMAIQRKIAVVDGLIALAADINAHR